MARRLIRRFSLEFEFICGPFQGIIGRFFRGRLLNWVFQMTPNLSILLLSFSFALFRFG